MAQSYIASDYAGIQTKTVSFYYGYEVTDENWEWCFQAKTKGGKEITVPFSHLGARDRYDCGECLLAGIAILFEEGQLTTASTRPYSRCREKGLVINSQLIVDCSKINEETKPCMI